MSADSPRHVRSGGPLIVPSQPPSDRSIIDAVSGFINDVTLSSSSSVDPKDVIQWARFETADINEPTPEGDGENDVTSQLLILGYGSGVQVWLIPPSGQAQEVLSWRQGVVRVLRILPTPQHGDCFASKRPLIALCDSAGPGPTFCSLSFYSIRCGEQVKSIKFKNPILDVLANKRSVVISFSERFAVFDAATLEDRMSVTTCYPCPCPLGGSLPINPITLGDRWLAYADKKINQSKRSSGGCEGEGVTSYTATVLHAAKSLSKGLRGLGESVAQSLAGGRNNSQSPSPPNTDIQQPGVVTILDIEGNEEEDDQENEDPRDPIIAHFVAHSEAIIALKFDPSGMLLITADRRGHDFHVFRINPHPCGPSLASVHHLYILHRGDTTAKVQDIAVSCDSRWCAVSTLRGTTHVFAVSPYGGACGVRTHTAPRVVNRLSRFHRSAGLPIHAAAKRAPASPASPSAIADSMAQGAWYPNPRLPPYPQPITSGPLSQLRPTANIPTHTITRTSSGRQRLSSLSEDSNAAPLMARARFGPPPALCARALAPVASLYLMAATGTLIQLLIQPKPQSGIPKEKVSDETSIDLEVTSIAQWELQRPVNAADLLAPLPPSNPLLQPAAARRQGDTGMSEEERWLSQVEIVTHAGPHRRLWMGPQFVFKTYNCTGSSSSLSEAETVEVDPGGVARSNPVNMPGVRPVVPVLIDSGSASSLEHSPSDSFRRKSLLADSGRAPSVCDVQLREDLAEAMKEDHGAAIAQSADSRRAERAWAVDPLGCVVQPAPAAPVAPEAEPELYATSNADEATFRPVLRAPAPPEARPEQAARALPATTTIPAQRLGPARREPPAAPASALPTAVVIPAALSALGHSSVDISVSEEVRQTMDARPRARESATAERESQRPPDALPKSRQSDDIQPTVESRVRRSPTPKSNSDIVVSDGSSKDSKFRIKGSSRSRDFGENAGASTSKGNQEQTELKAPKLDKLKKVEPEVPVKIEVTEKLESDSKIKIEKAKKVEPVQTSVKVEKAKKVEPVQTSVKVEKLKKVESVPTSVKVEKVGSVETSVKVEKPEKIEPVPTSVKVEIAEKAEPVQTSVKVGKAEMVEFVQTSVNVGKSEKVESVQTSVKIGKPEKVEPIQKSIKVDRVKKVEPVLKDSRRSMPRETVRREDSPRIDSKEPASNDPVGKKSAWKEPKEFVSKESMIKESIVVADTSVETSALGPLKVSSKKKSEPKVIKDKIEKKEVLQDDIKTEDQAWDMLLNEPDKPDPGSSLPTVDAKVVEEAKTKPKKSRKGKKVQDDIHAKEEEDTFVEIHAIEDKQQQPSGELVSISTPYEELQTISYFTKTKKSRSSKSATPEKKEFDVRDIWGLETELTPSPKYKKNDDDVPASGLVPDVDTKPKEKEPEVLKIDTLEVMGVEPESTAIIKEPVKSKKSKSLSPYAERKLEKRYESEVKDVYVIDTVKDEFPEIQITEGKTRKKSPQPERSQQVEIVEQPVTKSWSSIAATKSGKKEEISITEDTVQLEKITKKVAEIGLEDQEGASKGSSLQEKLIQLCKRPDIMVAECDAPTELNFVEEHHSILDLPPLEPLDFGLDDFKLEVMRDSLLEVDDTTVTSPICKINIDNILSTIKETTSKAIESSAFNLVDLEKRPVKKERGFNVVENDKITTQEVKVDDDKFEDQDVELTDSDKEEKKSIGASIVTLPSTKQSSKSKKSRKKRK